MNALIIGSTGGLGQALVSALREDARYERVLTAARSGDADLQLDLEEPETIAKAAGTAAELIDRLHLLIVATGILHDDALAPEKRLEDLDAASLQRYFAVNSTGPILVARQFFELLSHDQRAVLAAVSARVGSIGDNRLGGWYGYRSSKAALNMLLKTFAIEARRRAEHLIVAGLHPGTVDTSLSAPFQRRVPDDKLFSPAYSAEQLLSVIGTLDADDSGSLIAYDGERIEW